MADGTARVRMFGVLRAWRIERGEACTLDVPVPAGGTSALALAEGLGLPVERIEGVFVNHRIHALDETVRPGDDIAFVPHGTPGPHRFFLGLYAAGRDDR